MRIPSRVADSRPPASLPAPDLALCFEIPVPETPHPARATVRALLRDLDALGPQASAQADALGRLIPALLCGEESSVLVFERERRRLSPDRWRAARDTFGRIAAEEGEHVLLLQAMRAHLRTPEDLTAIQSRGRRFLRRLASAASVATHFERIAELDSCVCMLASDLLATPIGRQAPVRRLFRIIRADEARHVRAAREHAVDLGGVDRAGAVRDEVRSGVIGLLEPIADSLDQIGIDPLPLFRRLRGSA